MRVAYNELSREAAEAIAAFGGPKAIFLQDEYENTRSTSDWIRRLKVSLVFTVVPESGVATVYPPAEFPNVRFVSCLTGYAPVSVPDFDRTVLPSQRRIVVGYRGRPLPLKYGELGREKIAIGAMVKRYCEQSGIPSDIRWDEEGRIYGDAWPVFLGSCRGMLATESGSNVFDWDGNLEDEILDYRIANPAATEGDIHNAVIAPREQPGLMNQISPKVFEAIGARTALVLFEGGYSGVLTPWRHYLPLKKDGSNLAEVFAALRNGDLVDRMTEVACSDIILSGKHIFDYWRWDEKQIDDTLAEYDWEKAPDTKTTWRIGDGTAAFYNYVYYTVAGFTEHDTFRSNQIREGDLTRAEALEMVMEENTPRYPNIKWYLDAVGVDFKQAIQVVNAIPKLY